VSETERHTQAQTHHLVGGGGRCLQDPRTCGGLGGLVRSLACAGATHAHVGFSETCGWRCVGSAAVPNQQTLQQQKHTTQARGRSRTSLLASKLRIARRLRRTHRRASVYSHTWARRCARGWETRAQPNEPELRHHVIPTTRMDSLPRRRGGVLTPQNHCMHPHLD
jgi:hypothetical protein